MDFNDTKEEAEFRAEIRDWLSSNAIPKKDSKDAWRPKEGDRDGGLSEAKEWQAKKYEGQWACLRWPKEYGGRGANAIQQVIFSQEESKFKVPRGYFEIGLGMCGPTVMAYATEEQKRTYLPRMAKGEDIWCQLFSEPAAGSDVAGLRTKCVQSGDTWTVNGQKVWTSGAQFSDWGILVARHDSSQFKHKGLTFFFLSMHSDGVEVKPIKQISGHSGFNEVYFTDVKIPDSQRLGAVGDGWKVAITTLMNERLAVGDATGVDAGEALDLAMRTEINGKPAIQNDAVRASIANWWVQKSGLKYTKYRTISALSRGETPGPEASITKVISANKLQEIGSFGMDSIGMSAILRPEEDDAIGLGGFQSGFMYAPGIRIAGGTDEILRNIIAERVLGLPQDPRNDKDVPFNEIPTGR